MLKLGTPIYLPPVSYSSAPPPPGYEIVTPGCGNLANVCTRESKFKRISWTSDSLEGFVLCHSIAGSRNWLSDWAWLIEKQGEQVQEDIMHMVGREANGSDSHAVFVLCHSIAGSRIWLRYFHRVQISIISKERFW
ncbi:hypothetical protein MKW98_001234 [Papaver atlanticum]|uniref:Uncharacterized protein n=1 Tax=Papaver atlanticum TaxID=357466 RepID=A0AAD4XKA8_9MAGN|nr:hypothetical protein MKW98_001234 [Papaver atlanticum]